MKFLSKITNFINNNKEDSEGNNNKNNLTEILKKKKKMKIIFILIAIFFSFLFIFLIIMMVIIIMEHFGMIDFIRDKPSTSYSNNIYYWWPIGSAEETAPGIYGGDPEYVSISSYYGYRLHPVYGVYKMHNGVDIGAAANSNIIATRSGTVTAVGYSSSAGNYILIDHGDGISSFYCHIIQNGILVNIGDKVTQGQRIGLVGTTGASTGYHLHFEIRVNGSSVDPLNYISADEPRKVGTIGVDNKQTICLSLKAYGFDNSAVAAIMDNMYNESGYDPTQINELDCRGIVQWCFTRKNTLLNTYGDNWNNLSNQLEYFFSEIESSSYSKSRNALLDSSVSTRDKVGIFCNNFEAPGQYYCNLRINQWSNFTSYVDNGCSD